MLLPSSLVRQAAQQFRLPVWVDDLGSVESRLADLAQFDRVRLAARQGDPRVLLEQFRKWDIGVDVASLSALRDAVSAGYEASPGRHDILFSADALGGETLGHEGALQGSVDCGSPDMISQLGGRYPGTEVVISVSGDSPSFIGRGIPVDQIEDSLLRADQDGVMVTGLRIVVGEHDGGPGGGPGGGIAGQFEKWESVIEHAVGAIGRMLRTLIVPIVSGPADFERWDSIRSRAAEAAGHPIELQADADRWLWRGARVVVAEVCGIKKWDGRVIAMLGLSEDVSMPSAAVLVASVGDASQRESVEVGLVGRVSNGRPAWIELPMPRVGDYVAWLVDGHPAASMNRGILASSDSAG
ncbi:Diaminopimelate decarboxylase [Rubripirellula tenax]|uniref:Diaminopimelate decarboxylase n=1 Tax=Rubripirellula tenax TaxID=2528015 RepID=A0A5C6FJ47_9BACT|nr:hypothetical protein [Rubripirellula tenax]TWU60603.1 Diaminopimelate decarboxylase [Rubripirellula tenax]